MPRFNYLWGRARYYVSKMYVYVKGAFRRIINRVRRRPNRRPDEHEPNARREQPNARREGRRAFNILQRGILKRHVYKIQANNCSVTTIKKLVQILEDDLNYRGSPAVLRRLMTNMGLHKKVIHGQEYLMETDKMCSMRAKYLEDIAKYRNEGRPIVYTALTSVNLPKIRDMVDHRTVMAFAATEQGILGNTMTTFRYDMPISEWYYLIRYDLYENWIRTVLMPNLPPNSVVVMRNTPWNRPIVTRTAMESWLRERHITYESIWPKWKLQRLIEYHDVKQPHKIIEDILKGNNHTVLRIPYHHEDLNPLEVLWMHVQDYVTLVKTRRNINHIIKHTRTKLASTEGLEISDLYHNAMLVESAYRICGMHTETLKRRLAMQQSNHFPMCTKRDLEVKEDNNRDAMYEEPENFDTVN